MIPPTDFELGWIVGILEGEGTFDAVKKKYPRVRLEMTDQDSVVRVGELLGITRAPRYRKRGDKKPTWTLSICGNQAKLLMLDVFPHMSERRQQEIQEVMLDEQNCGDDLLRS